MDSREEGQMVLAVPAAGRAHYARNFIRQAVCEFRFPTLFDLEDPRPPVAFANAIRKEYPTYGALRDVNLNGASIAQANAHAFQSKNGRWIVNLRASSLTLETARYESFEDFEDRISLLISAAAKVIDSDFFTRIGIRYVNQVPVPPDQSVAEWINPALVGVLASGLYGKVTEHSQRVSGPTDMGGYLFQHGTGVDSKGQAVYGLDFDFFREDVLAADAMATVRHLHELEFSMFDWTLGPAAKAFLGPSLRGQ